MTKPPTRKYVPTRRASRVYDELYAEYVRIHDELGRDSQSILKRLKYIRAKALS